MTIRSTLALWGALLGGACGDARPGAPPPSTARSDAGPGRAPVVHDAAAPPFEQSCAALDPARVHLVGEEAEDGFLPKRDFPVIAMAEDYEQECYNFEVTEAPRVRHDGRLLYIASWQVRPYRAIHALVPDGYDDTQHVRVRHEDEHVPTSGCPEDRTRGVKRFVLDPESGDIYYTCEWNCSVAEQGPDCPAGTIYDGQGRAIYRYGGLFGVAPGGTLLLGTTVARGVGPDDLEILRSGARETVPVESGADAGISGGVIAAIRGGAGGFWIVSYEEEPDSYRWQSARRFWISFDGAVRADGDYGSAEPRDVRAAALDAEGRLYELRRMWQSDIEIRQLVRLTQGHDEPEVLFDDSSQAAGGIRLHITPDTVLATGF